MGTTKETTERTQRGAAVNIVTFTDLAITEGFNPRIDYGDITELADSIKENGVIQPLRGHKQSDGKYHITDGHRRYKALEMLFKLGFEPRIPLISDRSDSEEQRLINTIICNTGLRLNPVEEADVVQRLMAYHYKPKEIAKKLGFDIRYVNNLVLLASAPKKLKDMVAENVVSATQTLAVMRKEKDFDTAVQVIEAAVNIKNSKTPSVNSQKAKSPGVKAPNAKVTAQDIAEAQGKHNSINHLKNVIRIGTKNNYKPNEENRALYDFAKKLTGGLYNFEDLFNEIYDAGQYDLFKGSEEEEGE